MASSTFDILHDALAGNADAIALIHMIGASTQVLDDAADDPALIERGEAEEATWFLLCAIPRNPFYREHFYELAPIIEQAVIDWRTANRMEEAKDSHGLTLSFVLRDSIVALTIRCAMLIGGYEHATKWAPQLRAAFHDETLKGYLDELE